MKQNIMPDDNEEKLAEGTVAFVERAGGSKLKPWQKEIVKTLLNPKRVLKPKMGRNSDK